MPKIDVNKNQVQAPKRLLKTGILLAILSSVGFYPQDIYAANLRDLALEFINRVNPVYKEKEEFNAFNQIPDGGTLLLRPRSEQFFFSQDIYAIKSNDQIYLSLFDFMNVLEFPIDYDRDNLTGSGWFLREDWQIEFDLAQGLVTSRGTEFELNENNILEQDGDIFVDQKSLEQWFGLVLEINPEQQIVDIESPFPFPAVAKSKRESKFNGRNDYAQRVAVLPRYEQPKSNFDINTLDVALGNQLQRNRLGDSTNRTSASVAAQGEILKHNAYIFATADDNDELRNVRARLFKRSENDDLLGPLNARAYAFGDVDEVRIPLVSEGDQNLGFYFTNSTLENTDFATTNIEGRLFPGWDVQLFRNGVQIDTQTVGPDGEYDFENIQLFAGDNDFELFFFGPQGEIRSQNVSVPVSQALLSSQDNTYEISASLEDSQTYRDIFTDNEDADTPNLTARYNKLIGDNHLAYMGFRTSQVEGDRKFFLTTGSTSTLGNTLLDTNLAVDQEGEASAQALVRRNLLGWDTSLRARVNSEDFEFEQSLLDTLYEVAFNAQKQLTFGGFRSSVLLDSLYRETEFNGDFKSLGLSLANSFFGTSVSNRLSYESASYDEINDITTEDTNLLHILSLRKNFGRFFLTLGSTYAFTPESDFRSIRGQLNYRHSNNFSTDLTLERNYRSDLDSARLNLNYLNDHYRLSPFIQYNTEDEIFAGVNLNFSMYDVPNSSFPEFTHSRLTNRGAASAFVYHDQNGNHVFDEGDTPLEGAEIQSLPSTRRAVTNESGYATMYDLPTNRATDISIANNGLQDPFMIPSTQGNSVYPVEGTIYNLEFPVQSTGEIDGTVYTYDLNEGKKNPVGFQTVELIPLDNPNATPLVVKAERDGYYVSYLIPPGDYLLMTTQSSNYGNKAPQIITVGLNEPVLQDMNIELTNDGIYVPYQVVHNRNSRIPAGQNSYSRTLRVKQAGKSELSETLFSMINKQTEDLYEGLVKIKGIDINTGNYDYYTALETQNMNNPDYLHNKCVAMKKKLVDCVIIINATLTK